MDAIAHRPLVDPVRAAYQEGRRFGLAVAALSLSFVAFVNLLGLEKSILAGVLALLAMRGSGPLTGAVRKGRAALLLAAVHMSTVIAVLVLFRDQLGELVRLLQTLS